MKRALLVGLLLFGMIAQAGEKTSNEELRQQRKAIYTEIKTLLDSGKISLKEAQFLWQNRVKQLKKEEAK